MLQIDKEGAEPDRVKQELAELELLPEEWGGQTAVVPVRAAFTSKNNSTNTSCQFADPSSRRARRSAHDCGWPVASSSCDSRSSCHLLQLSLLAASVPVPTAACPH